MLYCEYNHGYGGCMLYLTTIHNRAAFHSMLFNKNRFAIKSTLLQITKSLGILVVFSSPNIMYKVVLALLVLLLAFILTLKLLLKVAEHTVGVANRRGVDQVLKGVDQ